MKEKCVKKSEAIKLKTNVNCRVHFSPQKSITGWLYFPFSNDMIVCLVTPTAIAKSYSDDVVQYVLKRTCIENKPIKLLKYIYVNGKLELIDIIKSE